jgi:hypothetical protein
LSCVDARGDGALLVSVTVTLLPEMHVVINVGSLTHAERSQARRITVLAALAVFVLGGFQAGVA